MGEMRAPLRPVLKWGFIGTAVAVPLVGQSRRRREAIEARRAISEQEAASAFRPRTAESATASPPVEITELPADTLGGGRISTRTRPASDNRARGKRSAC